MTSIEAIFEVFREIYPEMVAFTKQEFNEFLEGNGISTADLSPDQWIFINHFFAIFSVFLFPFEDHKGNIFTGWEGIKKCKPFPLDKEMKQVFEEHSKAEWKVFRVVKDSFFSNIYVFKEVDLNSKLGSKDKSYSISVESFGSPFRKNTLFLGYMNSKKKAPSLLFKAPLNRKFLLQAIEHQKILKKDKEFLKKGDPEFLKSFSQTLSLISASIFSIIEEKKNISRYEREIFEHIQSSQSLFSQPLLDQSSRLFGSDHFSNSLQILNFSKLLKVLNRAQNIENFGDYNHVFLTDEEDPIVLVKLHITEDKKTLELEPLADESIHLVYRFLKEKARDYVDIPDEMEYDDSDLFELPNKPANLASFIEDSSPQKESKFKKLLGFEKEEFLFPIIAFLARTKEFAELVWKDFSRFDPKRENELKTENYLEVFFEYVLCEAKVKLKDKYDRVGDIIIQNSGNAIPDDLKRIQQAFIEAKYFVFSIENYDEKTTEFIVKDLITNQLSTVHYLNDSADLLEQGDIYVGKKILWNGRNILTLFVLSYPKNFLTKIKKILSSQKTESMFEDVMSDNHGNFFIQWHLDGKNANLGKFPLE